MNDISMSCVVLSLHHLDFQRLDGSPLPGRAGGLTIGDPVPPAYLGYMSTVLYIASTCIGTCQLNLQSLELQRTSSSAGKGT